ncbi:hypothetical protein PJL15_01283 [Paenarthrobacter nitroguajacolicus]|nr:hypothetical protein [Paenarthrobacter nitroguajacolicus]
MLTGDVVRKQCRVELEHDSRFTTMPDGIRKGRACTSLPLPGGIDKPEGVAPPGMRARPRGVPRPFRAPATNSRPTSAVNTRIGQAPSNSPKGTQTWDECFLRRKPHVSAGDGRVLIGELVTVDILRLARELPMLRRPRKGQQPAPGNSPFIRSHAWTLPTRPPQGTRSTAEAEYSPRHGRRR